MATVAGREIIVVKYFPVTEPAAAAVFEYASLAITTASAQSRVRTSCDMIL
jgi:hypothetical protein